MEQKHWCKTGSRAGSLVSVDILNAASAVVNAPLILIAKIREVSLLSSLFHKTSHHLFQI